MTPSPYQSAILSFLTDQEQRYRTHPHKRRSLLVSALAGSGKTTLCLQALHALSSYNCSACYAVFNTAAESTMQQRAVSQQLSDSITIKTAHKLGLAAARSVLPTKFTINGRKLDTFLWDTLRTKAHKTLIPTITRLTTIAKDSAFGTAYGPQVRDTNAWNDLADRHGCDENGDTGFVVDKAIECLEWSNRTLDVIDFSDMIYLPLLLNASFPQFDYVFVDEAQDTNTTRRELFKKMMKPWGAMVIVGDARQAIYGFTGADTDALARLATDVEAHTLPLNICYRCDTAIIKHAQHLVPELEVRPDALPGEVKRLSYQNLLTAGTACFRPTDAILCRFNAPLTTLAFHLLRKGVALRIEGRDIGAGVLKLLDKCVERCTQRSYNELLQRLTEHKDQELSKATSSAKATSIEDKHETLRAIILHARDSRRTMDELRDMISSLFVDSKLTDKPVLTLSSVHKAKGREWDRVFLLGRDSFMPAPRAAAAWELEQEDNLTYVAITRAKHTLIEVTNVA